MGPIQWVVARALVPGEPAVDRTRKQLIVPISLVLGPAAILGFLLLVFSEPRDDIKQRLGFYFNRAALLVFAIALTPVGVCVVRTRRITRRLCEFAAVVSVIGIAFKDSAAFLYGEQSMYSINIVVLDSLLLCSCSTSVTKGVLVWTGFWVCARSVLEWEEYTGSGCSEYPPRFSGAHFIEVANSIGYRMIVLLADFAFTRSFAQSMHEQKAMVDASIEVSEVAAVWLSRYKTEDTEALLNGPDGGRLPTGLRAALLQLVANLAQYRPYLPQSCLPDRAGDGDAALDSHSSDVESDVRTSVPSGVGGSEPPSPLPRRRSEGPVQEQQAVHSRSAHMSFCGLVTTDTRHRRVSLVAVNMRGFLELTGEGRDVVAVKTVVNSEVDAFSGDVATERGVVDIVSGDHMFASFNASRMCTTHRLGAARVAWAEHRIGARRFLETVRTPRRTACVCSGLTLCGDLGASSVRRFMLLGPTFNTLQCLERVAAKLDMVLVDESVAEDADVWANFFTVLVERLTYSKRGPKPFLVWHLTGCRDAVSSPEEWMYELQRQTRNPHEAWNQRMAEWLNFGRPFLPAELHSPPHDVDARVLSGVRGQAHLAEATVVGCTAAVPTADHPMPK